MPHRRQNDLAHAGFSTQRLLQSIGEVTEHHDCRRFRRSLADTICEMVAVQELVFVKPQREPGGLVGQVLHAEARRGVQERLLIDHVLDPDGLLVSENVFEMMEQGHFVAVDGQGAVAMLPVLNRDSLIEIVALRAEAIPRPVLDLTKAFIRLYRNFLSLIHESETDPLTGLYNRRTLEFGLPHLLLDPMAGAGLRADNERRQRAQQRSFLAVVDIDHFKRINDTLGHVFGDEVIILVARLMRQLFRGRDHLFRYGGEEFVIVMQAEDASQALAVLERFRERVASHRFPQLEQLTVSAGITELQAGEATSSAIGRADRALYDAKSAGRNRVCDYRALLERGGKPVAQAFGEIDLF